MVVGRLLIVNYSVVLKKLRHWGIDTENRHWIDSTISKFLIWIFQFANLIGSILSSSNSFSHIAHKSFIYRSSKRKILWSLWLLVITVVIEPTRLKVCLESFFQFLSFSNSLSYSQVSNRDRLSGKFDSSGHAILFNVFCFWISITLEQNLNRV